MSTSVAFLNVQKVKRKFKFGKSYQEKEIFLFKEVMDNLLKSEKFKQVVDKNFDSLVYNIDTIEKTTRKLEK